MPSRRTSPRKPLRTGLRAGGNFSPCHTAELDARRRECDREFVGRLVAWFRRNARPLPWRTVPRQPWPSLISEVMAQQTQIARVLERFDGFVAAFPSPRALADAPESDVLAAWSGLGYYRRARLLQRAAREIVGSFDGVVPSDIDDLIGLAGVGRYTAGAIASIVFGKPAPIVDGNVARVLLRISARPETVASAARWTWKEAERLAMTAGSDVSEFNEGLMELGALVCTPKSPGCHECPLAGICMSKQRGTQESIPTPRAKPVRTTIRADVLVVRDAHGRLLVEQRPDRGLWASMWQAPTREAAGASGFAGPMFEPDPVEALAKALRIGAIRGVRGPQEFTHVTSHRLVEFRVWWADAAGPATKGRRWLTPEQLMKLPLANPQRDMLLGGFTARSAVRPPHARTLRP